MGDNRHKLEYSAAKWSQLQIRAAIRTRGVVAEIFFPIEFGHYSGKHNDIKFNAQSDKTIKVLIPNLYSTSPRASLGGLYDTLYSEDYTMWADAAETFPVGTLVKVTSRARGVARFLVEYTESNSAHFHELYRKIILSPYQATSLEDKNSEPTLSLESEFNDLIDNELDGAEMDKSLVNSEPQSYKYTFSPVKKI